MHVAGRDSVVSTGSEPERHHLRSVTNLNYIHEQEPNLERTFSVSGPIVWNSLPLSVKQVMSQTLDWLQTQPEVTFLTVL